jgi:hypothetical protein
MIKSFEKFLNEEEYHREEDLLDLELFSKAHDPHVYIQDWMSLFDDEHLSSFQYTMNPREQKELRKMYSEALYEWKSLTYEMHVPTDHNHEDDPMEISDEDQKELDDLVKNGWKQFFFDIDERGKEAWSNYLMYNLLDRNDSFLSNLSSRAKKYITSQNLPADQVKALSTLLLKDDFQAIRGAISGIKYGL